MNRRGFTATELILGIVIMAITSLAFAPLLTQAVASYALATTRARTVHDTRHAMFQITRELLLIGTNEITAISPTQIQFIDQTGVPADYRLQGGSIFRGNILLVPNVNALTFTYLDGTGTATAVVGSIRRIGINLRVTSPSYGTVTLRSEVFPRGFVYNNFQ